MDFFEDIIMDVTNDEINEDGGKPMSWHKFLWYIGLWSLMSTLANGCDCHTF